MEIYHEITESCHHSFCNCISGGVRFLSPPFPSSGGVDFAPGVDADGNDAVVGRMMIWSASLSMEVGNISNALTSASEIARKSGGYVESKSGYSEKRGHVRLRVPAGCLKNTLGSLELIGTVTSRRLSGRDVTEEYIDVAARLKNRIALRDRLQQLLDKADNVKDVLAIEKELNRVQSDIDSMQGRIKSLKGKVDLATINLDLKRKKILGPLGYFFKGLFWGVENSSLSVSS